MSGAEKRIDKPDYGLWGKSKGTVIHVHAHRHGDIVHSHPHHHGSEEPHGPVDAVAEHDHEHETLREHQSEH